MSNGVRRRRAENRDDSETTRFQDKIESRFGTRRVERDFHDNENHVKNPGPETRGGAARQRERERFEFCSASTQRQEVDRSNFRARGLRRALNADEELIPSCSRGRREIRSRSATRKQTEKEKEGGHE